MPANKGAGTNESRPDSNCHRTNGPHTLTRLLKLHCLSQLAPVQTLHSAGEVAIEASSGTSSLDTDTKGTNERTDCLQHSPKQLAT